MKIIHSRMSEYLESHTLEVCSEREVLLRTNDGFLLYVSGGDGSADERIVHLEAREALIWLNREQRL
ncbi:hypothetical protein [Bradyrhizobium japonicum]|uniref:hypothetical protein n=1 Tax=Bradyrhizobium japonicum TaxID=375 RepID=UPI0027144AFF|nr:hypothetical protein [Bradyrhizobium japonicum]WLB23990.1 hypothetical protein QIH95_49465 [Bradyrhizobium japonicum]